MIIEGNPDGTIGIEVPVFRQYIINDSTIEANADVFINQPRGVLLHNDELSSLPLGFGKYKKSQGADAQHYLEIWNANPITINRVGTGVKYVANTGMAIIGGIPTRMVTNIFSEDNIHNGLLPRFLPVLVDNKLPYNEKTLSEDAKTSWCNILNKCYEIPLKLDSKTGRVRPLILHLNNEAFDLYVLFRYEYDQLLELLPERTRAFIPKLQTYCLRFAGILHIIRCFESGTDISNATEVCAEIMNDAIKLTRYYTHQVDKLVQLYSPKEELQPHQKRLINILYKLRDEVENGRLYLKRITEIYNQGLPKYLIFDSRHVGNIVRKELGLKTDISHDSYLIWDDEILKKHFRKLSKLSKLSKELHQQTEKSINKRGTYSDQHLERQEHPEKAVSESANEEILEVEFIEEVKTNV